MNYVALCPRGVWQSVRIEVDIDHDRFNFYSGQRGTTLNSVGSNLPYRSGSLQFIDRFTIARFTAVPDADAYFDNIVVGFRAPTAITLTGPKILGNGSFQFSFANNPGTLFSVLMSTNVALARTNWTVPNGVTEVSPGQYQFTDTPAPNNSPRFYDVRSP